MTPRDYQRYSNSMIEQFDQMLKDQVVQKNIETAKNLTEGFGNYMENFYCKKENIYGERT